MTFHHQTIFDPKERCMKPLHPFELVTHNKMYPTYLHLNPGRSTSEVFPFLGCIMQDNSIAAGIADGLLDPSSLEAFNLPELVENVNHLNRRHSDSSSSSRSSRSTNSSSSSWSSNTSWSKGHTHQKRTSPASAQTSGD